MDENIKTSYKKLVVCAYLPEEACEEVATEVFT
jgi:hypothetical protein